MAGPIASLFVALGLDARDYTAGLKQAGTDAQGFAGNMTKIGAGMASVGKTLTLGLTLPIIGAAGAAIKLAQDAEDTDARLTAAFKSMGADAWTSLDTLQTKASDLMSRTTFDDEAVKDAQAVMLTFGGVTGDTFDAAIESALNMSTALGTDLQGAVLQVGKALNDPVGGITALKRAGVSFSEKQKDVIKALVETGDVAGAQAIIIGELKREFGGMAEAAAGTSSGQMKQAMNELAEAGEEIGTMLLPVIRTAAGLIKDLAKWFQSLSPEVKTTIVQVAGLAAVLGPVLFIGGKLIGTLGSLVGTVGQLGGAMKTAAGSGGLLHGSMTGLGVAAGTFAAGVLIANEAGNELEKSYAGATEQLKLMTDATPEQIAQIKESGRVALERADALKFMGFWDTEASVALRTLGQEALTTADRLESSADAALSGGGAFSAMTDEWKKVVGVAREVGAELPPAVATGMAGAFSAVPDAWKALAAANVEAMAAPFRALGQDISGQIGQGMQDNAQAVFTSADELRRLLKDGLTPEALGIQAIGKKYINLVMEGMDSEVIGAKETARSVAIQAINSIEDAGLHGAEGQRGLKAIGIYYDELLASGMTAANARVALAAAGVSGAVIDGLENKAGTVRQGAVDNLQVPIMNVVNGIDTKALNAGEDIGRALAAGLDAMRPIVRTSAQTLARIVTNNLQIDSPAKEGPWAKDGGPMAVVKAAGLKIGGSLAAGLRDTTDAIRSAANMVALAGMPAPGGFPPPSFGLPTMPSLGLMPPLAMAGGGTIVININGNINGAAGLRQLHDDMEQAVRQGVRGANRQAGR